VSALVVCVVFDCGGEEGVDEGSLSESRFTSNLEYFRKLLKLENDLANAYHDGESCSSLGNNLVSLVWQIGNPNRGRAFRGWRSHCEST
jgi:hypothetical protein